MKNPYALPGYLSEEEKKNCYATNRGWILLKPNGKYEIVVAARDLDVKIKEWSLANGVEETKGQETLDETLIPALANAKKSDAKELKEQLDKVRTQLESVKEKIEVAKPAVAKKVEAKVEEPKTEAKGE